MEEDSTEAWAAARNLVKFTVYLLPEAFEGILMEQEATQESLADIVNRRLIVGDYEVRVLRDWGQPAVWVLAGMCLLLGGVAGMALESLLS